MSLQSQVALPHSTHAERVVLAGLMREPELVARHLIDAGLNSRHLYHWHHRATWGVIWDLIGCGCETYPADVWLALRGAGLIADMGGGRAAAVWLADVWWSDPTGAWAAPAAVELIALAERRRVIHAARETIREAMGAR